MIADLRWYDDLDFFGSDTADESENYEQDCYHVIIEDPGSNLQDPNSGLGLENALSGVADPALASLAEAQLAADQRTAGVAATVNTTTNADGSATTSLDVALEPDPDYVDTSDTITLSVPIVGGAP